MKTHPCPRIHSPLMAPVVSESWVSLGTWTLIDSPYSRRRIQTCITSGSTSRLGVWRGGKYIMLGVKSKGEDRGGIREMGIGDTFVKTHHMNA